MESEEKKKAYNEYVERITPNNSLTKDMWNAFWIGGLICVWDRFGLSCLCTLEWIRRTAQVTLL